MIEIELCPLCNGSDVRHVEGTHYRCYQCKKDVDLAMIPLIKKCDYCGNKDLKVTRYDYETTVDMLVKVRQELICPKCVNDIIVEKEGEKMNFIYTPHKTFNVGPTLAGIRVQDWNEVITDGNVILGGNNVP